MIRALMPATVDIRTDVQGIAGKVVCNPGQIQQLIVNLCNNAFQALNGGGHIRISLYSEVVDATLAKTYSNLHPGPYAIIEVADTGRGMDQETASRIFEPFFTTQDVGQGTGLGLSVVHGTVTRHGGEVLLDSEPGEGSRFRVYLPLDEEAEQQIEQTG